MVTRAERQMVPPKWGRTTDRRWVRWNAKMKAEFLDHLSATCNVAAAAASIGVDPVSVYALRRRDAAFADAWGGALALGYEMLETQLVGHAIGGGGDAAITNGAVAITGPIDVALAERLLMLHGKRDGWKPGGPRPQVADADETRRAIMKKLVVAEARTAARRAAAAAGEVQAGQAAEQAAIGRDTPGGGGA